MSKQMSLSFIHDELKEVKTHKREFLEQMDAIMPWGELYELVRPCYYKGVRGNKPYDLELMRCRPKKYNCDLALAEEYLKVVRGIRNQQPFYVTDEDVALDDSWNYVDIRWNGMQAEKVQRAFETLNFREQTLLEKRLAICMTCGRVSLWKNRPTFEELAVMFEGSTASGAERAYRKAVNKLTELLVAEGALHAVRLKQKSQTRRKKKIAAAIYEYQVDCDGEWGEISLNFENGTTEIIRLADWNTMKTNRFANRAIAYLLNCENEKLPKETMVTFEP